MTPTRERDTVTDTDVLTRYAEGGLAGAMPPGERPALVVVDLQKGFTDPTCGPGFDMPEVVSQTARLVEAAHTRGVPVVFTTISFPVGAQPVWLTKMPAMLELRDGTSWVQIDPETGIAPADRVVVKQAASAFSGTDLAEVLHGEGVDTVIVCGATTSGCVRATVVDAISVGLRPFVVASAVGDRERAPHDAALVDIQAKYGEVVPIERALQIIEERS